MATQYLKAAVPIFYAHSMVFTGVYAHAARNFSYHSCRNTSIIILTQKRRARSAPTNSKENQPGISLSFSLAMRMADPFQYNIIPRALIKRTLKKAVCGFLELRIHV